VVVGSVVDKLDVDIDDAVAGDDVVGSPGDDFVGNSDDVVVVDNFY
ncbi:unnamed protein product, partial [Adineta steineri]